MKKTVKVMMAFGLVSFLSAPALASDVPDGASLFNKKCKMCHALDRKKVGPAVKTMNFDAEALRSVITNGRKLMPKFGHKFSPEEIDSLVVFLQAQHD